MAVNDSALQMYKLSLSVSCGLKFYILRERRLVATFWCMFVNVKTCGTTFHIFLALENTASHSENKQTNYETNF